MRDCPSAKRRRGMDGAANAGFLWDAAVAAAHQWAHCWLPLISLLGQQGADLLATTRDFTKPGLVADVVGRHAPQLLLRG